MHLPVFAGEIDELDGLVSSLRAQRPQSAEQTQEEVPEADAASPLGPEQVQSGIPETEAAAPGSVPDLAEASAEAPLAQVLCGQHAFHAGCGCCIATERCCMRMRHMCSKAFHCHARVHDQAANGSRSGRPT